MAEGITNTDATYSAEVVTDSTPAAVYRLRLGQHGSETADYFVDTDDVAVGAAQNAIGHAIRCDGTYTFKSTGYSIRETANGDVYREVKGGYAYTNGSLTTADTYVPSTTVDQYNQDNALLIDSQSGSTTLKAKKSLSLKMRRNASGANDTYTFQALAPNSQMLFKADQIHLNRKNETLTVGDKHENWTGFLKLEFLQGLEDWKFHDVDLVADGLGIEGLYMIATVISGIAFGKILASKYWPSCLDILGTHVNIIKVGDINMEYMKFHYTWTFDITVDAVHLSSNFVSYELAVIRNEHELCGFDSELTSFNNKILQNTKLATQISNSVCILRGEKINQSL